MQSHILQQKQHQVKLKINISAKQLESYFDQVFQRFAPGVEIAGFRPGRAPKRLIIEKIGLARLNQEVADLAVRQGFAAALAEHKLRPVTQPKLKIVKWVFNPLQLSKSDTLEYEAEFALFPKLKLGDYKKIKIKFRPLSLEVKKDEVEAVLKKLRRQQANFISSRQPAKIGDWVEISFLGKYQRVTQESLTSSHHPFILGKQSFIPGFEEKLVGLTAGQKKQFQLTLPADFKEKNLAGKQVAFEVTMEQVKKIKPAPLNDQFAAKFGYQKLAALRRAIAKSLQAEKERQNRQKLEEKIFEQLLKISQAVIPPALLEEEVNRQIGLIQQDVARQGLTLEKYLSLLKKNLAELKKELEPRARRTIKIGLILGEIARREGLNPQDKDAPKRVLDRLIKRQVIKLPIKKTKKK